MYQSIPALLSEPNLPPEEKPKTPVLLTDSDGTMGLAKNNLNKFHFKMEELYNSI
jgi:hypothetical protein